MHVEHILGLPALLLHSDTRYPSKMDTEAPLHFYGPHGLHEFICSTLRLSESSIKRNVVVHEMVVSDDDAKTVYSKQGQSPWSKSPAAYRRNNSRRNEEHPQITRIELHSTNGQWVLVDDPRVTVVCRLVSHRIPSFGFVVEETDKGGPIIDAACKKASLPFTHFDDVKSGKDVVLPNGSVVKASDVTGPSIAGRKLVYLGDTQDASNIINAATDCDVLVHGAWKPESWKKTYSSPIRTAAEMALVCRAKRLVLNRVGCQYLPIDPTFKDEKNSTDSELLHQAIATLQRPHDVVVARDYLTVQLPMGGYSKAHANSIFYLDPQRHSAKNVTQLAEVARRRQEIQQHTKAVAVSHDSSPKPSDRAKQHPNIDRNERLAAPESAVERILQRPIVVKARAVITPSTMRKRTTNPASIRDQKHSYNKASMHLWSFKIETAEPPSGLKGKHPYRNNTDLLQTSTSKPHSKETYSKKPSQEL